MLRTIVFTDTRNEATALRRQETKTELLRRLSHTSIPEEAAVVKPPLEESSPISLSCVGLPAFRKFMAEIVTLLHVTYLCMRDSLTGVLQQG